MRLIVFGRLHSPHKMCFLHLLLLVLGLGLPLAVVSLATPPYMREDLLKICPKDGSKKAISLGTKAAILTLQVGTCFQ